MNHQPGPMLDTPYKGLMPYAEEDAPFFFGREPEREIITANLMAWRLTLLYGPSGVGKSSLLSAGVVHHLRQTAQQNLADTGTPEFAVVVFSAWRDDPLAGLVAGVEDAVAQALETRFLEETWFLDPTSRSLPQALQAATEHLGGDLLIILDQFEEYFLYHPQEDGAGTFAGEFPRAVNRPDLRVSFLIAIREDALAKLDRFKGRVPNLFDNYLRVEHLDREAAQAAIEQPVVQYNRLRAPDAPPVSVEPALVEAVLDQVRTGQVAVGEVGRGVVEDIPTPAEARIETPYLQLVMTRLWDEEMAASSDVLRLGTLNRLGGAEQIVRHHLDTAMGALPLWGQEAAVRVFHHLVTPSGTKIAHTVPDLAQYAELPQGQLTPVLEHLSDPATRILRPVAPPPDRPGEPRYEIFHDVLAPAILDWRTRAEGEQQLAEERLRVRRLRWGIAGLAFVLLAVMALAVFALQQRATAETARAEAVAQQKIAFSRELAAAALNNLVIDPERSVLLALQALSEAHTLEAENALHRVLPALRVQFTLVGHTEKPNRAIYSPDGTRMVTSSNDDTVKVWDADSGEELLTLTGHTGDVMDVDFSPDGRYLATSSFDGTAKVWDISTPLNTGASTGQALLTLSGHTHEVWGVSFSPDGTRLATSSTDATARVWDASSGQELLTLSGHQDIVYGVMWSPDGTRLATASNDRTARVWDATTGQELLTLTGHTGSVNAVRFSPDGAHLATPSEDSTVRIWDTNTGETLLTLFGHESPVVGIAFSPDGTRLVTGSYDGTAKIWDASSGRELFTLAGHAGLVQSVAFHPDGTRLVTSSEDGTVKVWDLSPDHELLTLAAHPVGLYRFAFSRDGTRLVTGGFDGVVKVWDTASGQELLTVAGHMDKVNDVAFSPDGSRLATTCLDGTAKAWDTASGQELYTITNPTPPTVSLAFGGFTGVAFSPDGMRLAIGSDDGTAQIRNAETGEELLVLRGHGAALIPFPFGGVVDVLFSPDGTRLATAGADGTARLWDAETGQEILILSGHEAAVVHLAFSPDGTSLATASQDGTAKIWDVSTIFDAPPEAPVTLTADQASMTLLGHTGIVLGIDFSRDGTRLATASFDNTAKVWDVASGEVLLTLTGHTQPVFSVAFSPDGTHLATGSWDGTVRFYVLPIDELVALARERVTRSLTTEECRKYLHVEECPAGP